MKKYVWLIAALAASLAISSADGEESGWHMPNLNPFSSKSSGTSAPPTSGWKVPNLLPKSSTAKRRKNQPSTMTKMTQGTKKFFSQTADALNPFDDKPVEQPKITGSNSIFTQQRKAFEAEKKQNEISAASWWGGEKKDSKPKSVNDFLSQPRP